MNDISRRRLLQTASLASLGFAAGASRAQDPWPSKPIRLIVAFAPGGFTDIAARLLADNLSRRLGQAVIVDNRAGAAGLIGTQAAAQAPADGYTLLLATISTHAINVGLYKKLPYDPVKDFVPVSGVATGPLVLAVSPGANVKTVAELIAVARKSPGKLTYASGGNGTTSHLAAELFKSTADISLLHIPFRSPSLATTGLLGGQVDLMFDTVPTSLPHVRSGRVLALGVTGTSRVAQLPDVPVLGDTLKGFDPNTWAALYAPAGTPAPVVAQADAGVRAVLASPEVQQRLSEIGMQPLVLPSAELAAYVRKDTTRWVELIRKNGITAD
jgi:tripartite-type tricarboxylate transporter receptor subunit TctC